MAEVFWPFDPSIINYGFGYPPGYGGFHNGIDFPVAQGTPLRATVSGIVRNNDAGWSDGAGIDITTDDGWMVRHWHVSNFGVPNGSRVNAGDIVGATGGTPGTWGAGNATGPHLHWGIMVSGNWVDPAGLDPKMFGSSGNKGNKNMLMIHKPSNDANVWKFAVFGTGFWLEFVGSDVASGFAKQIGANSVQVTPSFWDYCKTASQAPVNVKGGTGGNVDVAGIAKAVNDDVAKRMSL